MPKIAMDANNAREYAQLHQYLLLKAMTIRRRVELAKKTKKSKGVKPVLATGNSAAAEGAISAGCRYDRGPRSVAAGSNLYFRPVFASRTRRRTGLGVWNAFVRRISDSHRASGVRDSQDRRS